MEQGWSNTHAFPRVIILRSLVVGLGDQRYVRDFPRPCTWYKPLHMEETLNGVFYSRAPSLHTYRVNVGSVMGAGVQSCTRRSTTQTGNLVAGRRPHWRRQRAGQRTEIEISRLSTIFKKIEKGCNFTLFQFSIFNFRKQLNEFRVVSLLNQNVWFFI